MKQELKTPSAFVAWEANPLFSRDRLTVTEETKRGDILILTGDGYKPYHGTKLTAKSDTYAGVIAIALEDGEANKEISVIARGAVIVYDKLNHTKADDESNLKPIDTFKMHAQIQQLVFRNSINPNWSA